MYMGFKYWVTGMPQLSRLLASLEFSDEKGKLQDRDHSFRMTAKDSIILLEITNTLIHRI